METVHISSAAEDDVPALAAINMPAYQRELISGFAWNSDTPEEARLGFFRGRIMERVTDPDSLLYKATDSRSGKILGFICMTIEEKVESGVDRPAPQVSPSTVAMRQVMQYMDVEFVKSTGATMEALKRNTVEGAKHYYISSFAVDVGHQGEGIGSQLLRHCLEIADRDSLRTWLVAFPRCHDLYERHGFVDVKIQDIDLNAWDKYRYRGYGVYRQYVMVREPTRA